MIECPARIYRRNGSCRVQHGACDNYLQILQAAPRRVEHLQKYVKMTAFQHRRDMLNAIISKSQSTKKEHKPRNVKCVFSLHVPIFSMSESLPRCIVFCIFHIFPELLVQTLQSPQTVFLILGQRLSSILIPFSSVKNQGELKLRARSSSFLSRSPPSETREISQLTHFLPRTSSFFSRSAHAKLK